MTEDQQQQKLSALLRLKRFEQPPPGYFAKLLQDVHRRQRADLLRRPLWKIAVERVQTFFSEHSTGSLQYGGAMAAVLAMGIAIFAVSAPSKPDGASHSTLAVAATSPVAVDLRTDDITRPKLLTLQDVRETAVTMPAANLDEPVSNARLMPESSPRRVMSARPTRYIIDARPVSYDAKAVSFQF